MKNHHLFLLSLFALTRMVMPLTASQAKPDSRPLENLSLNQALELAESLQPQIAEAKALIEAAEGRARQAGAYPNPEAIVGAQQLPFRNNAPEEKEYVAGVEQAIPLAGRLRKARRAELLDREVRRHELEVKRRDIRQQVHSAFANALYQAKAYQTQSAILNNAERAVATTQARVVAGDAPREDLARLEIELARAKVELQRAESLRQQALVALVSAMGDATLTVKSLSGTLEEALEIPTLEVLIANLSTHPEIALANSDVQARHARVEVAKAERFSEVRAQLLYHRLEGSRENTIDVGVSIPLPLFNRNQGRLREARAEVAAAEARARAGQNELVTRLHGAYLQLTSAVATSRTFKTEILAKADLVLKTAEARYAAGDISLAEILPLRRDWAMVQINYLESLREVVQAWAALTPFVR